MTESYVIPTPEQAAFHEAGHCSYAIRDVGKIVEVMLIRPHNGGWEGSTRIVPDYQSSPSWTSIALAGPVAEAMYQAMIRNPENFNLQYSSDSVDQIDKFVQSIWPSDEPNAVPNMNGKPGTQVDIWIQGEGQVAESSISREDVLLMTPRYRNRGQLDASFRSVIDWFNSEANWQPSVRLATAVLNAPGHIIRRGSIQNTI